MNNCCRASRPRIKIPLESRLGSIRIDCSAPGSPNPLGWTASPADQAFGADPSAKNTRTQADRTRCEDRLIFFSPEIRNQLRELSEDSPCWAGDAECSGRSFVLRQLQILEKRWAERSSSIDLSSYQPRLLHF